MPSREERGYELNEVSWWAKWVDETVWVSKNCYAVFSDTFKDEYFYNRGGFLGEERVPDDAIDAVEREFAKRKRSTPCILVEEGRRWDRLRASLSSRGYTVGDRMLVMEVQPQAKKSASNPGVEVTLIGSRSKGKELQMWTRTYLQAFYGDQRLNDEVNKIMKKVVKDKKASVILARMGETPVGCAVMYRSTGGVAGAYCIGTAPSFRKKGVAATILRHMRAIAEGEGRRLILQTLVSDSAEGFYLKQGFRLAYTKTFYERPPRKNWSEEEAVPSGEAFGVTINRGAATGTTRPFVEVFSGFEDIEAVRGLFGPDTEEVISKLKISLDSPKGYLRVDGETGNIIINPEYLKTGHERHLYLDVIHELAHVKQFREGKELYDRRFSYFERPTEIEAYRVAVEEARRIGMDKEEIVEYLRVEWVTEEEFMRFVSMMRIDEC